MNLLPAIDIKGGRLVRLLEGGTRRETTYDATPPDQARAYIAAGARWLHVVDMDRAFAAGRTNDAIVREICGLPGVEVQVGGNLASVAVARDALAAGARRVVLGTSVALEAGELQRFTEALERDAIAVAVDVRGGAIALRGARYPDPDRHVLPLPDRERGTGGEGSSDPVRRTVAEVVARVRDAGIATVVYRDLERDGLLVGADLAGAMRVARLGVKVIVAGGVRDVNDLVEAKRLGLEGVIVGRALHEGRFTLAEALGCCS